MIMRDWHSAGLAFRCDGHSGVVAYGLLGQKMIIRHTHLYLHIDSLYNYL
jgi:hypothetical protein